MNPPEQASVSNSFFFLHFLLLNVLIFFFCCIFSLTGPSGKKAIFYRTLFVAAFPNAMIENNNSDNSVPSIKQ